MQLFILCIIVCVAVAQRPFTRFYLPNAVETLAVCNDGTPAVYYFRPSITNSTIWNIWLMGGFWCWDTETCKLRASRDLNMVSSKQLPPTWDWAEHGTIFDEDQNRNPNFWNANSVWAWYCTSDAWSGDGYNEELGFEFRGKRVIKSLVDTLAHKHGLENATKVLLSGCSAGSLGVSVNADYVQSLLPIYIKHSYTYKAIIDSGLFFDIPTSSALPQKQQFQKGVQLWNGIPNEACKEMYNDELWRCYLGEFLLPFIDAPILVRQDRVDWWQFLWGMNLLGDTKSVDLVKNETQIAYATMLGDKTVSVLQHFLENRKTSDVVWAPACVYHCMLQTSFFTSTTIQEVGLSQIVGNWFSKTSAVPSKIDLCHGFLCSGDCPKLS